MAIIRIPVDGSERVYLYNTRLPDDHEEKITFTGRGQPPGAETNARLLELGQQAVKMGVLEISFSGAPARLNTKPLPLTVAKTAPVKTPNTDEFSDDQLMDMMTERYNMFANIVEGASYGDFPAVIVSGGPGQGKSSLVGQLLAKAVEDRPTFKYHIAQGATVSPITFYEKLYQYRDKGNVLVMDDSDTLIKRTDGALLLKSAMDSKDVRRLSWGTRASLSGDTPYEFDYKGSLIFLSNQNFRHIVRNGNPMHENIQHLGALISRVNYLDLMMHTTRARWLWTLSQIQRHRILENKGLTGKEQTDVLNFMKQHIDDLNEVSIRTAVKMVPFVKMSRRDHTKDWRAAIRMMEFAAAQF